MRDRLRDEEERGRVETKTRLFRWAAESPGEALVLQAAGWTGSTDSSEPDIPAARAAAAEAARLSRPAAAVNWLVPGETWWEQLIRDPLTGAAGGAAVALSLGSDLEDKVRARLKTGDLAAGIWLEAAGNALLAEGTARVRAALVCDLSGDGLGAGEPILFWVAPGCHGVPVEHLAEIAAAAGGEAAGITALPGGGLRPGKSVAGLFVFPAAGAAGEGLRRRLTLQCAGCRAAWCPGRAAKPGEKGQT